MLDNGIRTLSSFTKKPVCGFLSFKKIELSYTGGVPEVILTSNDNHYKGYEGCIGDVRIQDSGYVNLNQKSLSGKNVASCNR